MFKKFFGWFCFCGTLIFAGGGIFILRNYSSPEIGNLMNSYSMPLRISIVIFLFSVLLFSISEIFATDDDEIVSGSKKTSEGKTASLAEKKAKDVPEEPLVEVPLPQEVKPAEEEKILERAKPFGEEKPVFPGENHRGFPLGPKTEPEVPSAAYQILSLFQKEGRLLDFLMEDISSVDDESLGGAIRPIHDGCKKILRERLVIEPVLMEPERSELNLGEKIDPNKIKLTGNVPANGPYSGVLVHRGWKLKECNLPVLVQGWTGDVIVPAEVEIP